MFRNRWFIFLAIIAGIYLALTFLPIGPKWIVTDDSEDQSRYVISKDGHPHKLMYVCDSNRQIRIVVFAARADTDKAYRYEFDLDGRKDFIVVQPSNVDPKFNISDKPDLFAALPDTKIENPVC